MSSRFLIFQRSNPKSNERLFVRVFNQLKSLKCSLLNGVSTVGEMITFRDSSNGKRDIFDA